MPGLEVHDSPEQRAAYAYDGTAALRAEPAAVVFPVDTAQVSGVLKFAAARQIPMVTRGSGTGLSGGSVPVHGCLVLCPRRPLKSGFGFSFFGSLPPAWRASRLSPAEALRSE